MTGHVFESTTLYKCRSGDLKGLMGQALDKGPPSQAGSWTSNTGNSDSLNTPSVDRAPQKALCKRAVHPTRNPASTLNLYLTAVFCQHLWTNITVQLPHLPSDRKNPNCSYIWILITKNMDFMLKVQLKIVQLQVFYFKATAMWRNTIQTEVTAHWDV